MCGIAGWFSRALVSDSNRSQLELMVDAIRHRGPDGTGTVIDGHAALGHTRLAIIDLESGQQPMTDSQGEVRIIFNGEIYNYKQLREDLAKRGCTFKTHSDTEVILNLYIEEGHAAFRKLRGMYAIAIWDGRRKVGVLARDPFGIKPLFYALVGHGDLLFASEAKAILACGTVQAELDENSLHLLMNFRYIPGDATMFHGVRQLSPGTIMEWHVEGPSREFAIESPQTPSMVDVVEALHESVQAHLTADVEVATYLSGGLDSGAIAAIGAKATGGNLRSFTLNMGDDPNEVHNASETARILGIENITSRCALEPNRALSNLIWHLEVPKINAFQVHELAMHTSRHVKVVLSGLGGDELFLGYNVHRLMHIMERFNLYVPRIFREQASRLSLAGIRALRCPIWSEPERAARMADATGNWSHVYGLLRNVWDDPGLRRHLYGPRLLDNQLTNAFTFLREMWPNDPDPVMATAKFEWKHKLVNDLLWQEDRCSMAEGLEVRVPFLDVALVSTVCSLRRDELMPNGRRKGFMQNMLRGVLPREVLNRPKSGFQVNATEFYRTHLVELANVFLSDEKVKEYGIFNPKFVKTVKSYRPGKYLRWHYFVLYLMLTTHLWIDLFEKPKYSAVN